MPESEVPELLRKAAKAQYVPAFLTRCAQRGYTHIRSEEDFDAALQTVDNLRKSAEKSQNAVDILAKHAMTKLASQK